jgi:hypothetical protein
MLLHIFLRAFSGGIFATFLCGHSCDHHNQPLSSQDRTQALTTHGQASALPLSFIPSPITFLQMMQKDIRYLAQVSPGHVVLAVSHGTRIASMGVRGCLWQDHGAWLYRLLSSTNAQALMLYQAQGKAGIMS